MLKSDLPAFLIKELKEVLPPTLFFALGFNLIVLTINLILADYLAGFANFMVATMCALVVGKAVLVANAMPLLRVDCGGVQRNPRNRLVQHYSGGYPGIPDHGLGFFSDLQILAICVGGGHLSAFASPTRRSICNLYNGSLRDPAYRLLRRPGSARH
jgi:hypothetical protein